MSLLRFDNRVAIVTGSGGGLGRAYALFFASRGAKVVVNDLGGGVKGDGSSTKAADLVVEEIRKAGGEAIPNYDSVENGAAIVKTAVDKWGRVDILVNNAGILRDVSFVKMTNEQWDIIQKVHLYGAYMCTKAAWPYMRDAGYGRIINTSSASGLYGNAGQANYAAAKLALVGFSTTLAKEGASKNILVNAIAPVAGTRMTATVLPQDFVDALKPEFVVPMVAYLCHETSQVTGKIFELGGGWVSAVRWERSKGAFFDVSKGSYSPEDVATQIDAIMNYGEGATYPTGGSDAFGPIMENLERAKNAGNAGGLGKNEHVDVALALQHKFAPSSITLTARDVALYALSVGMARDPMNEKELAFVYENSSDFAVLPSMGVVFPLGAMMSVTSIPGLLFNPMMLLHGEQSIELLRPIPAEGTLTSTAKIAGIYDKGKGALLQLDVTTVDAAGNEICKNRSGLFIRGIGGFGGAKQPAQPAEDAPTRAPDCVHEDPTPPNLALLYRWPGMDLNPLHADPQMASMGGFERPILHGLATFGHAARAVLQHYANYDTKRIKAMRCRFTKHVYPGETIVTEMWKLSDTKIAFRARVKERDGHSISGGVVELHAAAAPGAAPSSAPSPLASSSPVEQVFAVMEKAVAEQGAELVKSVKGVIHFVVGNDSWVVDLKTGSGKVFRGQPDGGKADVTLTLADETFVAIFTNKTNAQEAFLAGKLKMKGNMAIAQKLSLLTADKKAKL